MTFFQKTRRSRRRIIETYICLNTLELVEAIVTNLNISRHDRYFSPFCRKSWEKSSLKKRVSLREEFFILLHSGEGGREEGEATTTTTTTSARHEMNFDPVVTRGVVKYEITPVLRAPLPPSLTPWYTPRNGYSTRRAEVTRLSRGIRGNRIEPN